MKKLFLLILLFINVNCYAVDLREYFPKNNIVNLRKFDGTIHSKYTLIEAPDGYLSLYNNFLTLNKPGHHYVWKKEYKINGKWCAKTAAILFMGDDKSVTEVGDWMARGADGCTLNTVFGYKNLNLNINSGLIWSPPGGLNYIGAINEMRIVSQDYAGGPYVTNGFQAYSKSGIIEHLSDYKPEYGRGSDGVWCKNCGKSYDDVIHIVMYHGTKAPSPVAIRCETTSPIFASGVYYQSFKNYNSYAIELWLAKGVGIIKENFPFVEDASYWNGYIKNCSGALFDDDETWSKYIDD